MSLETTGQVVADEVLLLLDHRPAVVEGLHLPADLLPGSTPTARVCCCGSPQSWPTALGQLLVLVFRPVQDGAAQDQPGGAGADKDEGDGRRSA